MPWKLRLAYAWKSLKGQVHVLSPIDVSRVKTDLYMEGTVRVYLTPDEADKYVLDSLPVRTFDRAGE